MKRNRGLRTPAKVLLILITVFTTMIPLIVAPTVRNQDTRPATVIPMDLEPKVTRTPTVKIPQLRWNYTTGVNGSSSAAPAVADVNNDGKQEVVTGGGNGKVYCLNSTGGLKWSFDAQRPVYSPTIADVDGDGQQDVLIASCVGMVYCLNGAGGLKWSYSTGQDPTGFAILFFDSAPVVEDLDSDGRNEVLVAMASLDHKIYCLNATGKLKWSYTANDLVYGTPAVADVDEDGEKEVVIASVSDIVYCLSRTGISEWNFTASNYFIASPAVADVDGDEHQEVVMGSWVHGAVHDCVFCLDRTGGLKWGYTHGVSWTSSSPAIADINGDLKQEIIVGVGQYLVSLNGTGYVNWVYLTEDAVLSTPATSDVDLDGAQEILIGSDDHKEYCLSNTGGLKWSFSTGNRIRHRSTVADIDGDGQKEILVGSTDGNLYCLHTIFASTVVIRVVDYSSMTGIPGASVISVNQPPGQTPLGGSTNQTGYITFNYLLPGFYNMSISLSGFYNRTISLTLGAGERCSQEMPLHRTTGSILICVLDYPFSQAISGVSVVSTSQPQDQVQLSDTTNSSGYVSFESIRAGRYNISISKNGYHSDTMTIDVVAEQIHWRVISLREIPLPDSVPTSDYFPIVIGVLAALAFLEAVALVALLKNRSGRRE